MSGSYDEDLSQNPFFVDFCDKHPDLLQNCISDNWILCVPRIGSLDGFIFTLNDFLSHILVPDEELPKTHFLTLTEKSVTINNRLISIELNGELPLEIHILFDETFYTEDDLKYKVLCIEAPLCLTYKSNESLASSFATLTTLKDCIDFLWTESGGRDVFEDIDNHLKKFEEKYSKDDFLLSELHDKVSSLYTNCLQAAFKNKRLKERHKMCQYTKENIKLAVETYMHHGIYKKIFESIGACTAYEDANLNKIIRNLSDIQLRDLEINLEYASRIPTARQNLSRIQSFSTILGKVNCIKNTIEALSGSDDSSATSTPHLTTDELLPLLIFLVIKSGLPNWHTHLNFMKHFRFSMNYNLQLDEISYLISTLEAVIEHIKSGILIGSPLPESQWTDSSSDVESKICEKLSNNEEDIDDDENTIEYLFKQVKLSNYNNVKRILEKNTNRDEKSSNVQPEQYQKCKKHHKLLSIEDILDDDIDFDIKLCHPLCTCKKCSHTLSKNKLKTIPSVFSCNNHGLTVLHMACIYGNPKIIDLILESGANSNAMDCNGSTPLHFATSRGHQNALLILLHAGAIINAENMDKNTPLHLATNNGHDSCVKALIYFAEYSKIKLNVNVENDNGETPLHLASKWGYEVIARLLLEYGADPWKCNRKGKNAIDFAHSSLMTKLLSSHSPNLNDFVNVINIKRNVAKIMESDSIQPKYVLLDMNDDINKNKTQKSINTREVNDKKNKPQSLEGIREVERLFRAIAYGDTKLACFYMNIELEEYPSDLKNGNEYMCHPLCVCEKCTPSSMKESLESEHTFNINICDPQGNTALHIATEHGHLEICKILLRNGATIDIQNINGLTPLHVSAKHGHVSIADLLIQTDANVNSKDSLGNTPLHFACTAGNVDIVKLLMETGNVTISKNTIGKTPLDEARDQLFLSVIDVLEKYE